MGLRRTQRLIRNGQASTYKTGESIKMKIWIVYFYNYNKPFAPVEKVEVEAKTSFEALSKVQDSYFTQLKVN
jgi:predicted DNA-binding transcriptional regulator